MFLEQGPSLQGRRMLQEDAASNFPVIDWVQGELSIPLIPLTFFCQCGKPLHAVKQFWLWEMLEAMANWCSRSQVLFVIHPNAPKCVLSSCASWMVRDTDEFVESCELDVTFKDHLIQLPCNG